MFKSKLYTKLRSIVRRNNTESLKRRRVINDFCESYGLVYFGVIDQHKDDYQIIKGLTASAAHRDDNCAVGTIDGYDLNIAYRTDEIKYSMSETHVHSWLIMEFKLNSTRDLPHIFIGGHDHGRSPYTKLFVTHPAMQKVPLGTHGKYSPEFESRYSIYSQAANFVRAQEIFDIETSRVLAAHFWPLSIEVFNNMLYIYSDNRNISPELLEAMIKNGLWLAGQIDSK